MMNELSIIGTVSSESSSALDIAIDKTPLSGEQAKQLTHSIRDASEVIWILIARAHAGKAWKVLGYDSWEDYVKSEFNMSRSRSYQLLDQAKVISAIEEAMPEGVNILLTEAAARELRTVLEEAVPEIRKATENLEGQEALKVTEEILTKYREKAHADVDPVFDNEGETPFHNSDIDILSEVPSNHIEEVKVKSPTLPPILQPESSFQSTLESPSGHSKAPTTEGSAIPDLAKIRKLVNAAHDIYSSLSALSSLPIELIDVINTIPAERHIMIDNNLKSAKENLDSFDKIWQENKKRLDKNNEA